MLSTTKLWLTALLLFVMATTVSSMIDYIGEQYYGVEWSHGADLFPNGDIGPYCAGFQLLAALMMIAALVSCIRSTQPWKWKLSRLLVMAVSALAFFIAFAAFAYWYHTTVMGRTL